MATLVCTPDMHQIAEFLDTVRYAALEEAMRFEVWIVAFDIHLGRAEDDVAFARRLVACGRSISTDRAEPAIGQEQRTEAIPISLLARRPGDHVIKRGHEVVHGVHITGVLGGGPAHMLRNGSLRRRRHLS